MGSWLREVRSLIMPTQQQITAAAFALCPHICPLKGCDHLHCTPDRSTMEAAKAALEAAERVPAEGLFQLTVVERDWPSDWQDQFRKRYPRNISMAAAIRQIEVLKKKKEVTYAELMAGVDRYAESVADAGM